jgi:DNA polymerase-3 subunit gamma/tau
LIEHTKYKPAVARYKIFIIDEVHMLTTQAFNALLKTLEEPPSFIKFILATTDPLKLPATILSRTQHFRFRKISQPVLERHLENILKLEGVKYEKGAVSIIARSGAGSVRDALTLLDQAIIYSKDHVDISTITKMLGIIEPSLLEDLISKVLSKDRVGILNFISMSSEFEAEMVIDELMLYLKDTLLSGSDRIPPMTIERFFRVLAESKHLLSMGSDGEFVLSLTLFKMMADLSTKYIKTSKEESSTVEKIPIPEEIVRTKIRLQQSTPSSEKTLVKNAPPPKEETISTPTKEHLPPTQLPIENSSMKKEEIRVVSTPTNSPVEEIVVDRGETQFKELVDKLYDRNYELGESFNASIRYISFQNNILTWESTAYGERRNLLRHNWTLIRTFMEDIFGYTAKIKNIPKELPRH